MTTPDKAQLPPLQDIRRLIADDAYAASFQSFGQYRTALLKTIENLSTVPAAAPVMAWAHPDGRVVPAKTKADAEHDGGAFRSSLAGYTIPLVAAVPAAAPQGWPEGLLDRVKGAEQRIRDNHAPRRIPADPTDVDLVLAEVRALIEGRWPPFWIKSATTPPAAAEGALRDRHSTQCKHYDNNCGAVHPSNCPDCPFRAALSTAPAPEASPVGVPTDEQIEGEALADLSRAVQAESIVEAQGWAWDRNRQEWVGPAVKAPEVSDLLMWAIEDGVIRLSKTMDVGLQDALVRFASRFAAPTPAVAPSEAREDVARLKELRDAAQAVVERWDAPLWKDLPTTANYINRLRAALATPTEAAASALGAPASPSRSPLQPSVSAAIVGAEAMSRDVRMAVMLAYGHLWHVNSEPMAPIPMYSPEKAAYEARKQLRDLLSHQERGEAINQVGVLIGRYDIAAPNAGEQT